jgi:hypothetical protein
MKKKAWEKEKDQFNNERDRFLEGMRPSYTSQINNILEDISITAEAAQKPPRPSIMKPDNHPPKAESSHRKQSSVGSKIPQIPTQNLGLPQSHPLTLSPRGAMRFNQPLNFSDEKIIPEELFNSLDRKGENKRTFSTPADNAKVKKIQKSAALNPIPTQKKLTGPPTTTGIEFCTLCKGSFDKNQLLLCRGKPFCPRCNQRLLEGAKLRGMNI